MKRLILLMLLIPLPFAAWAAPPATKQANRSPVAPPVVDYTGWPATTERPFAVDARQFAACMAADAVVDRGPHREPALRMYTNEIAHDAIKKRSKTMPIGAIVVKEKWTKADSKRPIAYAAMIKHSPGYDSNHGDWEYVYVDMDGAPKVQRGRVSNCIRCHSSVARRDYLFGTHLTLKAKPPRDDNSESVR